MATWPPSRGSIGKRLKIPTKRLMEMRMIRRSPIPAWAAWPAVRTAPTMDSTRVPLVAACWAALALVTWSNRWTTPLGEKRCPTPTIDAQLKWTRSDPGGGQGMEGSRPLDRRAEADADDAVRSVTCGCDHTRLVHAATVGRGHGERPGPPTAIDDQGDWCAGVVPDGAGERPQAAGDGLAVDRDHHIARLDPRHRCRTRLPGDGGDPLDLYLVGVGHPDQGQQCPQQDEGHQEVHG